MWDIEKLLLVIQVQWDRSPDFTSGLDGEAEGQAEVDATQILCDSCVLSFSLDDLKLTLDGTADYFGRLNAGNRILVSTDMITRLRVGRVDIGMFRSGSSRSVNPLFLLWVWWVRLMRKRSSWLLLSLILISHAVGICCNC